MEPNQLGSQAENDRLQKIFIQKNADNRVVPAALLKRPIDFNLVIDDKKHEQSGDNSVEQYQNDDEIDPSEIHRAEPYFEFFDREIIKKMFSK